MSKLQAQHFMTPELRGVSYRQINRYCKY